MSECKPPVPAVSAPTGSGLDAIRRFEAAYSRWYNRPVGRIDEKVLRDLDQTTATTLSPDKKQEVGEKVLCHHFFSGIGPSGLNSSLIFFVKLALEKKNDSWRNFPISLLVHPNRVTCSNACAWVSALPCFTWTQFGSSIIHTLRPTEQRLFLTESTRGQWSVKDAETFFRAVGKLAKMVPAKRENVLSFCISYHTAWTFIRAHKRVGGCQPFGLLCELLFGVHGEAGPHEQTRVLVTSMADAIVTPWKGLSKATESDRSRFFAFGLAVSLYSPEFEARLVESFAADTFQISHSDSWYKGVLGFSAKFRQMPKLKADYEELIERGLCERGLYKVIVRMTLSYICLADIIHAILLSD